MNDTLEKRRFIGYSFCRHSCGFFFAVLFSSVLLSVQAPLFAQSDEAVSFDSRRMGASSQEKGDFRKALFYYERALALTPGDPAILNDIGLMHEYLGHNKAAEEAYLNAIALDRGYLPVYGNLGFFYSKQGQYALAIKYLKMRIAKGRPDDPWILHAQEEMSVIYDKVPALNEERIHHEARELEEDLSAGRERMKRRATRDQAVGFEVAYERGLKALEDKQFDAAIEAFESAVALDPNSGTARHALKRARYDKEKGLLESQAKLVKEEIKGRQVAQALNNAAPQ